MSKSQPPSIQAELHTHSTFSDGAFEPAELAARCAAAGVRVWALSDHDTVGGVAAAAAAAAEHDIEFLTGIEVSAYAGRSIHVLGYGYDPTNETLRSFSTRRLQARRERMEVMIDRLAELGAPVDRDHVFELASGAVARPHLAQALVDAGHANSRQAAFDRYIGNGRPAYVETTWPGVPEAIEMIHEAGGTAVLAHPGLYGHDKNIPLWVEAGLDGIEVRHPAHSSGDEARYVALANDLGVLKTGSSDYHGPAHDGAKYFGRVELPGPWFAPFAERVGIKNWMSSSRSDEK